MRKNISIKLFWIALTGTALMIMSFHVKAVIMWGRTGSPGETTCVSCHADFPVNSGGGSFKISTFPAFINSQFIPGQTYAINITFAQPPDSLFNCDVEVIDSLGNNTGTITLANPGNSQLHTYSPNGRTNYFAAANNLNSYVFSFNWTAPVSGEANIYASGLLANGDGTNGGDYVYSDSLINIKRSNNTGLMNALLSQSIRMYPNPATSIITIECSNYSFSEPLELQIVNGEGKTVYNTIFSKQSTSMDISKWDKGSYTILLLRKGNVGYKKFLVY